MLANIQVFAKKKKRPSIVEVYQIPLSLVLNLDQTPLKCVLLYNWMMAVSGSKRVTINVSPDERCINRTFANTMNRTFLPVYLTYGQERCKVIRGSNSLKGFGQVLMKSIFLADISE